VMVSRNLPELRNSASARGLRRRNPAQLRPFTSPDPAGMRVRPRSVSSGRFLSTGKDSSRSTRNDSSRDQAATIAELEGGLRVLKWNAAANESAIRASLIRTRRLRRDAQRGHKDVKCGGDCIKEGRTERIRRIEKDERSRPLHVDREFMRKHAEEEAEAALVSAAWTRGLGSALNELRTRSEGAGRERKCRTGVLTHPALSSSSPKVPTVAHQMEGFQDATAVPQALESLDALAALEARVRSLEICGRARLTFVEDRTDATPRRPSMPYFTVRPTFPPPKTKPQPKPQLGNKTKRGDHIQLIRVKTTDTECGSKRPVLGTFLTQQLEELEEFIGRPHVRRAIRPQVKITHRRMPARSTPKLNARLNARPRNYVSADVDIRKDTRKDIIEKKCTANKFGKRNNQIRCTKKGSYQGIRSKKEYLQEFNNFKKKFAVRKDIIRMGSTCVIESTSSTGGRRLCNTRTTKSRNIRGWQHGLKQRCLNIRKLRPRSVVTPAGGNATTPRPRMLRSEIGCKSKKHISHSQKKSRPNPGMRDKKNRSLFKKNHNRDIKARNVKNTLFIAYSTAV